MRLNHLHLSKPIPYIESLRLQEILLERQFTYNRHVLESTSSPVEQSARKFVQPQPTLLTFQTRPVYTVGRRHLKSNPLSEEQVNFLTGISRSGTSDESTAKQTLATFYPSPRGGLLTYHAPGQLTAYLIINLRTHAITPRCFIRMLENTVIRTCSRHEVPNTLTTKDPGVWLGEKITNIQRTKQEMQDSCGGDLSLIATTRKICAIGVHVTRGITSHGLGLNVVDTPILPRSLSSLYTSPMEGENALLPTAGYLSWGFNRIIACGLEGKSVTWLTNEGARSETTPDMVATTLAEETCKSLTKQGKIEISEINAITKEDVQSEAMEFTVDV